MNIRKWRPTIEWNGTIAMRVAGKCENVCVCFCGYLICGTTEKRTPLLTGT